MSGMRESNDHLALEEQLVQLLPKLNKHALILTRSRQTAEDLVQDTCETALDRLEQWRGTGRFDGWVASIMKSIWLQKLRQKRLRGEQELPEPDQIVVDGFEDQAQARHMLSVMLAVSNVSEEEFDLLVKLHVYGYTHRDIAEEQGKRRGTVLSLSPRIRANLRRAVSSLQERQP